MLNFLFPIIYHLINNVREYDEYSSNKGAVFAICAVCEICEIPVICTISNLEAILCDEMACIMANEYW